MKKKVLLLMAIVFTVCSLLWVNRAGAVSYTMEYIIQNHLTIQIDDKIFSGFVYGSAGIPASEVEVTTLDTPLSNPGLWFTGGWHAFPGQTMDIAIMYFVQALGNPIKDISLLTGGYFLTGQAMVGVTETAYLNNTVIADIQAYKASPFATANFSPTFGPIKIVKDIIITAGPNPGDFAAISTIEQRFSQIPLPTTLFLLGSGLLALIGLSRKFRR